MFQTQRFQIWSLLDCHDGRKDFSCVGVRQVAIDQWKRLEVRKGTCFHLFGKLPVKGTLKLNSFKKESVHSFGWTVFLALLTSLWLPWRRLFMATWETFDKRFVKLFADKTHLFRWTSNFEIMSMVQFTNHWNKLGLFRNKNGFFYLRTIWRYQTSWTCRKAAIWVSLRWKNVTKFKFKSLHMGCKGFEGVVNGTRIFIGQQVCI